VALLQGWKNAGVTRVILKAGGGDSDRYQDSKWVENSANVLAAGLILEAYWFNGTTDQAGDAAFVVSFVPAGVRIWADVESEGSMPHWSDDQADVFERAVIAAGHPSGTYMSESVTFEAWPKCGRRPLWVADYGPSSVPAVGPSWSAPVLWQNTSSGHLPGYGGNLDLDQELAGLADLTSTQITAPPLLKEQDMYLIRRVADGDPVLNGMTCAMGPGFFCHLGDGDLAGIARDLKIPISQSADGSPENSDGLPATEFIRLVSLFQIPIGAVTPGGTYLK
jgi:hypothetical protein